LTMSLASPSAQHMDIITTMNHVIKCSLQTQTCWLFASLLCVQVMR